MKKINARIFLEMSVDEMWDVLQGTFILKFDDGEIQTNHRETLYSAYAWEFHRIYPTTPLLLKHHVGHILGGRRLNSDTHLDLLGNAMWSVYDHYMQHSPPENVTEFRDQLAELVYKLTNRMYNDLSYRLEEYVTSLDIVDFINVMQHPKVKAVNDALDLVTHEEMQNTPVMEKMIEHTYSEIKDALLTPGEMPNNPLANASQSGIVSMGQLVQCVGPRGFLTDTDSNIFRFPVLRGYVKGMRTLYNSLVESRSAAKSLLFSKTPLQQAEYFSRRLQLMSQIVKNLHSGDCGTTSYLEWDVRPAELDKDGKEERPSDLKFMAGKYYLNEETNQLELIKPKQHKHLIGKRIKVRSVMHCAHPDPYGVCSTCFGELSLSVPRSTNLGHMCCTSMTQKSSQMVLSVKHLDGSSAVDSIVVLGDDRKYLKVGDDETSYHLAKRLEGKKVQLAIPADRAANFTDILSVTNVEELNLSRISELEYIGIIVTPTKVGDVGEQVELHVHMGRRYSSMTYDLLRYIAQHRWDVHPETGAYLIDMDEWEWDKPILTLPLKHINMSDHSRDIAQLLESRVEDMHTRDKGVSPDEFLVELFNLVNDKLSVNLAVLEVILYGAMIRSAERYDYSLPKPWTNRGLGVMKNSMAYRSLGPMMAYESHHDIITSPISYTLTNRPDHPLDALLMPREVVMGGSDKI